MTTKTFARLVLLILLALIVSAIVWAVGIKLFIGMVLYCLFAAGFSLSLVWLLQHAGWLP